MALAFYKEVKVFKNSFLWLPNQIPLRFIKEKKPQKHKTALWRMISVFLSISISNYITTSIYLPIILPSIHLVRERERSWNSWNGYNLWKKFCWFSSFQTKSFSNIFISREDVAECEKQRVLNIKRHFYSIANQLLADLLQQRNFWMYLKVHLVLETRSRFWSVDLGACKTSGNNEDGAFNALGFYEWVIVQSLMNH